MAKKDVEVIKTELKDLFGGMEITEEVPYRKYVNFSEDYKQEDFEKALTQMGYVFEKSVLSDLTWSYIVRPKAKKK